MAELTISQAARQAGVRHSTLRYYEEIGLLPTPPRINGRRRYEGSALHRLVVIQTAQQAGFTLAEITLLFDDILSSSYSTPRWHDLAQRKLEEVNTLLVHVQSMKSLLEDVMRCDDLGLADCIYVTGEKHRAFGDNADTAS